MRTIVWDKPAARSFRRTVKKNPALKEAIEETLELLAEDPFDPRLETHKLKGKLAGSWACSAGYDVRIIFHFVKNMPPGENEILLIEIGTHDEVY